MCEVLGLVAVFQYRITEEEHVVPQVHEGREYFELLCDINLLKGPKSACNLYKSYSIF